MTMDITLERSYDTAVSNSALLPLLLLSLARQKHTPREATSVRDEYDYIVVGGGAAGSVVASRLSEVPCVSVLLLEAGPAPPLVTEVPAFSFDFIGTDRDWNFTTVPQRHGATALQNRQIRIASGKMLGGSGSHNGMAYVRGSRQNYDDWEAQGAKGWSYKDVLPYFYRMEDYRIPEFLYNGYHAVGGPLTVEKMPYDSVMSQSVTEAAKQLGYEFVDCNGARMAGFYKNQMNIRDGQRCSSVKGHLVPAENRTNLDIYLNAMVTKIIIRNNKAQGVVFHREGQFRVVKARREVIVSGGTVNSAKLLMLSGIGPREELEKFNIPVVADLPVGKNYHGHSGTEYFFTANPTILSHDKKVKDPANILQYISNRTGPLASLGYMMFAFLRGLETRSTIDNPNIYLSVGETVTDLFKAGYVTTEAYKKYFEPNKDKSIFQCAPGNSRPKSRGTVTLSTSNPFDNPLLDPNYLADPRDLEDTVKGLKICRNLLNTPALQALGAQPLRNELPGCEMYAEETDDFLRCYARLFLKTNYHDVGTCKMGDRADPTTVLDPQLRVKNVEGLRVVDASVMPIVPSGNINIPTIMVAEKASDIIKQSIVC